MGNGVGGVAVVGAGAVGLSVAVVLAEAGHAVTVIADAPGPKDCSPAAGAVWFPYGVTLDQSLIDASEISRLRFEGLADIEGTGVVRRRGTYIARRADADLGWADALPGKRDLAVSELPEGATAGFRVTVPVIDMSRYLPWLRASAEASGVRFEQRRLTTLDEIGGFDATVVAAGLSSGELVHDDEPSIPRRGQVVRVGNPGLTDWVVDEDAPGGLTYVIPRIDDIVLGGTDDAGDWRTQPDPVIEAGILERTGALVPEVTGLPIVSRGVGFRPGRSTPRVGWVGPDRGLLACYGHGGAGVTLSWGSAQAIASLLSTADD